MEDQEIQEIKKKKRYLKRYKLNIACIGRLEEKLTLLDERIKSVKSPNYSGMPRGGKPVSLEELLSDKLDLEKRIGRLKDKNRNIKNQILEEIDSLEDPRYCEVLEAFFIECKTIGEIAEEMGYTDRYIYDLYKNAVQELTFSDIT
jgi:hypothetical protein